VEVENTLQHDTAWPPVRSEDLAKTFQRMDSAFASQTSLKDLRDGDDLSLSGSETGSMSGNRVVALFIKYY